MSDLKSPKWIYLKGALFLGILLVSSGLVLLEAQKWSTVVLLLLIIWSAARFYYFLFYVIEKYVDPSYNYSGIYSLVRYFFRSGKK